MLHSLQTEGRMQVKPIVHGLVECLLVDGQNEVDVDQTVSVLVRQIQGMPGLMRFGMCVLLIVFDWYGLLRTGRRFRFLSLERQRKCVSTWASSPIGPCRDMVEFHRKMGTFVALSIEYERHETS